ncbi:hypothetical protein MKQ68_16945 [Chitinophaga horti]|uniref:GWxTD domain-containing protein n=1 Tax=Chitinophaga horti TaxID=2920382 RepID=A0ABY6IZF0_9BACT|nr:hypothetical protein [Chitinophaga horti]UYQ91777.1 hypothetical protein MKQ68_16945 [Chitinophaga horti]
MHRIYTLIAVCALFSLQACSRQEDNRDEKELTAKVDQFMEDHRKEWDAFENIIADVPGDSASAAANADRFRQQPFYKSYQAFLKDNNGLYTKIRTARLEQYAPSPAALKSVKWHTPGWLEKDKATFDVISLSFLRSWEPFGPGQTIFNMILPGLAAENYYTAEEINGYYRAREIFAFQVYAEPAGEGKYQVWLADRTMAITFLLQLSDYTVRDIRYTQPKDPAYANIQWTASVVKPLDETSKMAGEMRQLMWENYKSFDPAQYAMYETQRNITLQAYYNKHQEQFKRIRETQLEQAKQGSPSFVGYSEKTKADEVVNAQGGYGGQAFLQPGDWMNVVYNTTGAFFDEDPAKIGLRLARNAMFKTVTYAKKLEDDRWEVHIVSDTDIVGYIWDLDTGNISSPRYWLKS